ncbi:hypothetical protein UES1_395 [Escherichia phage UE-S1]|nr:hypothetical protein UES1_395 [Escherichia phage UE-S1]
MNVKTQMLLQKEYLENIEMFYRLSLYENKHKKYNFSKQLTTSTNDYLFSSMFYVRGLL